MGISRISLRNHHRGCGLCEQIKPSQRALARGLGCLLTKPKTKVMVPILTQAEFSERKPLKWWNYSLN